MCDGILCHGMRCCPLLCSLCCAVLPKATSICLFQSIPEHNRTYDSLVTGCIGFNVPYEGCASRLHWIITPRLRQIGCFETPLEHLGVVVYHPWYLLAVLAETDRSGDDSDGDRDTEREREESVSVKLGLQVRTSSGELTEVTTSNVVTETETETASSGGGERMWCMHIDCTDSLDSSFEDVEGLARHTRAVHD